jgi:hypothetical protein
MAPNISPLIQGPAIGNALRWQKEAKTKYCLMIQFSLQKTYLRLEVQSHKNNFLAKHTFVNH